MEFDHLVVVGETRAVATAHVEELLNVPMQPGGEHEGIHTHNNLMGLQDGLYLEAIAINPDKPKPERPRWFDLDTFTGPPSLTNWVCRCDDLDAVLASMPDAYSGVETLVRGDLRWRMAVPAMQDHPMYDGLPGLIQWSTVAHPSQMLTTADLRLTSFTITHPEADALRALLAPFMADPRVVYETGTFAMEARFAGGSEERLLR